MANADAHRLTWTLGLLTAASACLLPVGAEASVDDSGEVGSPSSSCEAAAQCLLVHAAHAVDERSERTWGSGIGDPIRRSFSTVRAPLRNLVGVRSQLLQAPGPPLYLIAPSQSPPGDTPQPTHRSMA